MPTAETFTPANAAMLSTLTGGVPVQQGQEIIQDVMSNSLMMQLAKYEEMSALEKEFDVFLEGPGAYWVGEGKRIQTSKATWAKVKMYAHKLGVIIPVSREYLNYKAGDFFTKMRPLIAEAFYKAFDAATFCNVANPYTQSVEESATGDRAITGDITVEKVDALEAALNDGGFVPNAYISKVQNNSLLRGLIRNVDGLNERVYDRGAKTLDGVPVFDVHKDITDFLKGTLYAGDFNYAYYGIPYGINYAISNDATLTTIKGSDGEPVNLFERDMHALRATMDIGFMILKDEAFASLKATVVP
ncbi:MAG: phage major capsid protein [Bacillota bacterium]|nr:phage major capsid protein [Bacillota bacterium]